MFRLTLLFDFILFKLFHEFVNKMKIEIHKEEIFFYIIFICKTVVTGSWSELTFPNKNRSTELKVKIGKFLSLRIFKIEFTKIFWF